MCQKLVCDKSRKTGAPHGLRRRVTSWRRCAPRGSRVLVGEKARGWVRQRARERSVAAPHHSRTPTHGAFRLSRTDTNPFPLIKSPSAPLFDPAPSRLPPARPAIALLEPPPRARARISTDTRRTSCAGCGAQRRQSDHLSPHPERDTSLHAPRNLYRAPGTGGSGRCEPVRAVLVVVDHLWHGVESSRREFLGGVKHEKLSSVDKAP